MQVLIDNEHYVKATSHQNTSIGIGITTHNRNHIIGDTYAKIKALSPDAKIVVVDDASDAIVRIDGATIYRFKRNVGIATAKNKCLELLSDCDHIFLFDDDTYPIKEGWYEPYINSKEHHLMYLFEDWANGKPVGDDKTTYEDGKIVVHNHTRGCMLYVDRTVLTTVGGMDTRYGKAMHEHVDWSNRIYNAGLTTFRYMDVPNSNSLIHSMDEHQEVVSSISKLERRVNAHNNNHLLAESETSTKYAPYGKDVVIGCYFSGVTDPQRNVQWTTDHSAIEKLQSSVEAHDIEFVLLHNCFDLPNFVNISNSPYCERWLKEWQYLRDHPEIENVFLVDSTDVDMIKNPFPEMENGRLYIGDEPNLTISCPWMTTNHREPLVNQYLRQNPDKLLLNCGVVGGSRQLVMEMCRDIYEYLFKHPSEQTEMGIFNYLMHKKYKHKIEFGRHVTSLFKQYEKHPKSWFRHK